MSNGNSRFMSRVKKRQCDYCGSRKVVSVISWGLTDKFYAMIGETPPSKTGKITESFCEACLLLHGPRRKT